MADRRKEIKDLQDISSILTEIGQKGRDIERSYKTQADLGKRLLRDKKFQKKLEDDIDRKYQETSAKLKKAQDEESKRLRQKMSLESKYQEDQLKKFKNKEKLTKQEQKEREAIFKRSEKIAKQEFDNMAKMESKYQEQTKSLQEQLRLEKAGIKELTRRSKISGKLSDIWASDLSTWAKINKSAMTFRQHIKDTLDDWKENSIIFNAMLFGLEVAGSAIGLAWKGAKAIFGEVYNYLDKKVYPMMASINKELGYIGGSQLRGQIEGMANTFDTLGLDFQRGADAVTGLSKGLQSVDIKQETIDLGLMLSEVIGMGAEEAGKFMFQFQRAGVSLEVLNKGMVDAAVAADKFSMPIQTILKDITSAPEALARFGAANFQQFTDAAVRARQYGLSIKEVSQLFGDQMDTFGKTSEVASKLNAVFGTQINSMKLMMETDPSKRMEMITKALKDRRVEYSKLLPFEKNLLKQQTGWSDEQLQMAIGTEKEKEKLRSLNQEKERAAKINQWWEKGILNIKSSLVEWGAELSILYRSISNVVAKMFGFEDASTGTIDVVNGIKGGIKSLTKLFNNMNENIKNGALFNLKDWLSGPKEELKEFVSYLGDKNGFAKDFVETLKQVGETAKTIGKVFGAISESRLFQYMVEKNRKDQQEKAIASQSDYIKQRKRQVYEQMKDQLTDKEKFDLVGHQPENILDKGLLAKKYDYANDALITKRGEVIKFNPNDNIMAFKDKMPSGTDLNMKSEIVALRQAINELKQAYANDTVRVEMADVNIDGRKIGEAQIRLARSQI